MGMCNLHEHMKEDDKYNQYSGNNACLYLFFGDSGLFLAVPLAVMKTGAIAVKYVEVMNGHLKEMRSV